MNIRERTEQIECEILSKYAMLSVNSRGRDKKEEECSIRTVYQCDRDRIIHSKAFRRLKHKTQVFISPDGDHYRTRLTHTLEVSQVARTIARALRLNEDLTEAIALGHDLGHTPFGHAGEEALNNIYSRGFRHYEQSVRVVDLLEKGGQGLNLSEEVKDGIICHTKGRQAYTLEGKVVRISDRIAYINHDIDDAIRAGVLKKEEILKECGNVLGCGVSQRIDTLVNSLIDNSGDGQLRMSEEVEVTFSHIHKFMYEKVYLSDLAKAEERKVPYIIEGLYNYFRKNSKKLPSEIRAVAERDGIDRAVCDYIAGMTDKYAIKLFEDIFIPKSWKI